MREIKLRAWDGEEWHYDVGITPSGITLHFDGWSTVGDVGAQHATLKEEPDWPHVQYIGIKDKKRTEEHPEGQEVYEGDIAIEHPYFGCEWEARQGLVVIEYGAPWMKFANWGHSLNGYEAILEIVGNATENPELLKETK